MRLSTLCLIVTVALAAAGGAVCQPPGQKGPGKMDFDKMVDTMMKVVPSKAYVVPRQPRKLLIYSKTGGFRHSSIEIGVRTLTIMGDQTGAYTTYATEDPAIFASDKLSKFDGVFMVSTTGDFLNPLAGKGGKGGKGGGKGGPPDKKAADDKADAGKGPDPKAAAEAEETYKKNLVEFVRSGKGLMGLHAATDSYPKSWPLYAGVIGGGFQSHPWTKQVPIKNLDPKHPVNAAFEGKDFEVVDEIYQFRLDTAQPTKLHMLLALDVTKMTDAAKGNRGTEGPYPVSWIANYDKGRVFYCSLGHREDIFWNPLVLKHYLAGIQFALGDLEADAAPTTSVSKK
jgi:type 1 glutamine amidotransferase